MVKLPQRKSIMLKVPKGQGSWMFLIIYSALSHLILRLNNKLKAVSTGISGYGSQTKTLEQNFFPLIT